MDADLQAEQYAILNSLCSEPDAEARCRRRQEMEAEHVVEVDEMLAYIDEEGEEEDPESSYAPVQIVICITQISD